MRQISLLLTAIILSTAFSMAQEKVIDTKNSTIEWRAKKVTGEHYGNITIKSGLLHMNNHKLTGGELTVDMNTISCVDIKNKDYNHKLIKHLESEDFFGVEKHPLSTLKLNSVKQSGNKYDVKGHLTIKGKTHPIQFTATKNNHTYTGQITVDRTLYDVRYGSGKFFDDLGDKMIYDHFELNFKISVLQ